MKYKLLRRSSLEEISAVHFPQRVRNTASAWTVMLESNNYNALMSLIVKLGTRDHNFKITDREVQHEQ